MKNFLTFEEFINEQYVDEAKSPNVTYNEDPKSYLAFNESKGPYFAGSGIYSNYGNQQQTRLFPQLGDRGLMMAVDGPKFRTDVCNALDIEQNIYGDGIVLDIPVEEVQKMAVKYGLKRKGTNFEKLVSKPEDGIKVIVDFLKPLMNKIIKESLDKSVHEGNLLKYNEIMDKISDKEYVKIQQHPDYMEYIRGYLGIADKNYSGHISTNKTNKEKEDAVKRAIEHVYNKMHNLKESLDESVQQAKEIMFGILKKFFPDGIHSKDKPKISEKEITEYMEDNKINTKHYLDLVMSELVAMGVDIKISK